MAPTDVATPCGLVAKSLFRDTFTKLNFKGADGKATPKEITMDENDIAWETDKKYKFKNVAFYTKQDPAFPDDKTKTIKVETKDAWKDVQWLDMTDPHFIVWMRYAGLPTFRKLYGKVDVT